MNILRLSMTTQLKVQILAEQNYPLIIQALSITDFGQYLGKQHDMLKWIMLSLSTVGSDNLVFILVNGDDCGCIYVITPKKRQVSTLRQNPYNLNVPCVYDFKVTSMRVAGASMKWRLLKLKCKQPGERSKLPLWACQDERRGTNLLHQYQARKHNLYLLLWR